MEILKKTTMKKAILATDLSQSSEELIHQLHLYKNLNIQKITLFHALGVEYMNFYKYVNIDNTIKKLDQIKDLLIQKGFDTNIVIKEGLPYIELEKFAVQNPESIIIIGTSGFGLIKGIIIGSTATYIINHTISPLLIIKNREQSINYNESGIDLIYLTDFSESSENALKFLLNYDCNLNSVKILHVIENNSDSNSINYKDTTKYKNAAEQKLKEIEQTIKNKYTVPVHLILEEGNVKKTILNILYNNKYHIVLAGKQGKGFFNKLIAGSVIKTAIEEANNNFLVIPLKK